MSKVYDTALQEKLRAYFKSTGESQASFAQKINSNKATISRYLSSNYDNGDVTATEHKIREYFRVHEARTEVKKQEQPYMVNTGYVPTTVSEDVYQSILFAQLNRCMAVMQGDAGVGKTMGAEKFEADNPGSAVLITASPADASLTAVVELLSEKLNIRGVHGRRKQMVAIREKLAGTNKVIIVDEAQCLSSQAIDELRSLSDGKKTPGKVGNGVCLIGNSTIQSKIKGNAENGLAQLFTRIHLRREYRTTLVQRTDIDALFPRLTREGREEELKLLLAIGRSIYGTRNAVYVYENAVRNDGDISIEGLRKAAVSCQVSVA